MKLSEYEYVLGWILCEAEAYYTRDNRYHDGVFLYLLLNVLHLDGTFTRDDMWSCVFYRMTRTSNRRPVNLPGWLLQRCM